MSEHSGVDVPRDPCLFAELFQATIYLTIWFSGSWIGEHPRGIPFLLLEGLQKSPHLIGEGFDQRLFAFAESGRDDKNSILFMKPTPLHFGNLTPRP